MSDPRADGPSEEELRAYLESLRAAQPVEIIVQSFGILATAAEVKLGRSDARVLIDGMAALLDATADRMPSEIVPRMRETVVQLQMAQVEAERDQPGSAGEQGSVEQEGAQADDAKTDGQQPGAAQRAGQQPGGAQGQRPGAESPASRLWIPGRD